MPGSIERRGEDTFRLIISSGKVGGKRKFHKKTIKVTGKSEAEKLKKAELELAKFVAEVESSTFIEPTKFTFKSFSEKWIKEYAEMNLAPKTVFRYKGLLERINFSLGHLKLDKIKPMHLIEFYNNLSEPGVRLDSKCKAHEDFFDVMTRASFTPKNIIEKAGVSDKVIASIRHGQNISYNSASKISKATDIKFEELFDIIAKSEGLSPLTIRHHHRLLHSILETAFKWQLIPTNPAAFADPPKVQRKEAGFYDEDEINDLFIALDNLCEEDLKYKVAVMVTISSGVRLGELLGLEWKHIDFENSTISIEQSNQYLPKKGTFTKDTKNITSKRIIALPKPTMDLLSEFRNQQTLRKFKAGELWVKCKDDDQEKENKKIQGFVFTQNYGQPMYPGTISSWFPEFLERNNLRRITFHQLRHTSATILINSGLDIKAISKRLGHARTSTTLDIYGHALESADKVAAEKMSEALFKNINNKKEREHA